MDFTTSHATPVVVRIDGTEYKVARFLLPQQKQWAAEQRQRIEDRSTAHLSPEDKARFLNYFQPPPVDVFSFADYARTPEGIEDVLERSLKAAGVPDEPRRLLIEFGDPQQLAALAVEITSAARAAASARALTEPEVKPGESADPLTEQPGASTGSPAIGQTTEQTSMPATAA